MKKNIEFSKGLILGSLFICLALTGCASKQMTVQTTASTTKEAAATEKPIEIGDSSFGFIVKNKIPMEVLGSEGIVYEHEKSGATLLYLKNEDLNRSFEITFRTPALDDKGKPHVFEHVTINGSQKYPDANLFFSIMNQTYNTFTNAFTHQGMTTFLMASMSEKQLMGLMDYDLSGVFEPLLYSEPRLMQREAWRYELPDADSDLNITGTVYSEMQGSNSMMEMAYNNNIKTLYSGSTTAHVAGGVPEEIRTLSYDELIEFHDTYYHPSNALIVLYGKLDIDDFLEYIDKEYLCKYDKKNIIVDRGDIEPFTETKYAEYTVPVEQESLQEKSSIICYSYALNGASLKDTLSLTTLSSVIMRNTSPVKLLLRERLPEAEVSCEVEYEAPSAPYLVFTAENVDPEKRDIFISAVDEGMEMLVNEGVSQVELDSVLANCSFELFTTKENKDIGINVSQIISETWTCFNELDYYGIYEQAIKDMTVGRADALIKKYLIENAHRAVSVTKQEAGLAEHNAEALAEELAAKKASMSTEEIDSMVQDYADYLEWAEKPVSNEIMSSLQKIKVADLPEEYPRYDIKDEMHNGVRYMSCAVNEAGVLSGGIILDGSTIPIDMLQDVQISLSLMGNLDTGIHSKEELDTLITRYLPKSNFTLCPIFRNDGGGIYAGQVFWRILEKDVDVAVELISELLFDTDYSDTETIKNLLISEYSEMPNDLSGSLSEIQNRRCRAMFDEFAAYDEHVNGFAMRNYIDELIELADSDPTELTKRLNTARDFILNRNGATVLLAGNEHTIAAYSDKMDTVIEKMTNELREKEDYSVLCIPKRDEGFVINSTVNMNTLVNQYSQYSGYDMVTTKLITDMYMIPKLRNVLGAYNTGASLYQCAKLYTETDPSLKESYIAFSMLPDFLDQLEVTQEEVDRYIISTYGSNFGPIGLMDGAMQFMCNKLVGITEDDIHKMMREVKSATPESVKSSISVWKELNENGVRSTFASESALSDAYELFDVIIYQDGYEVEVNE